MFVSGKTRLDNGPENTNKRRSPELGQGFQTSPRPEEGESNGFLLWTSSAGQDVAL